MGASGRVARGLLTDENRPVHFRFNGRPMRGFAGDTLASALLANGQRLIARSFKYHRPRGIVTAGPEEPCALVEAVGGGGREPNLPATTLELRDGLDAQSQNCWPSVEFDAGAFNSLIARFLPAGFYYKTFMRPAWAWERLYEPLIRRAAGLGRLEAVVGPHGSGAETVHDHVDVLIVGAGPAGLSAAHRLGPTGLRVLLVDQDVTAGGGTLLDERWTQWRTSMVAALAAFPGIRRSFHTAVVGAYGHGVFGALERLSPEESADLRNARERLRIVRAKRVIVATGAVERLIAFPGNDLPGVMLAGAGLSFLRRYGVSPGRRPVLFANSDEAYESVFSLQSAGVDCAGIVDVRATSLAADRARSAGIAVHGGCVVAGAVGRRGVKAVRVADADGRAVRVIEADCLLMSGGYSPAAQLATQLGADLQWHESIAGFIPVLPAAVGCVAGAAHGVFGLAASAADGMQAADAIAAQLGLDVVGAGVAPPAAAPPPDARRTPMTPVWQVRGRGKSFVDLQNDVTADDVRLAAREGYEHAEHMKRYTTHGMATDQGRIGGLVGSAVLAEARGLPICAVGMTKPRPYLQPIPFAALAGGEVRDHFKPRRRTPLHDWHDAAGATFANVGIWLRPLVYSRESGWEPVLQEARAVRNSVGITDVSTLGKIDVQGPDAARFLDFICANTFSTLPVGRARYGIMLREDGMLLDDGTTSRLDVEHFLVTTTTANSAAVFEHMEFHLQTSCSEMNVLLTDVGDQWAQFAIAGPHSRAVVAAVCDADLSNDAFPFMAAAAARIAGIRGRLFRISFSGELAYELAVPANDALRAWLALLDAGRSVGIQPYGLDALNTLRIEKGHVTGAEMNGNTSAGDLGMQRMLKRNGEFIGRALSQREGLTAPDRQQLIGVRPADRSRRLRNGAQILAPDSDAASIGFVTSSTPSAVLDGWVGLALLAQGRDRIGQRLLAVSPVHGERTEIDVVSPHHVDPENSRVRA